MRLAQLAFHIYYFKNCYDLNQILFAGGMSKSFFRSLYWSMFLTGQVQMQRNTERLLKREGTSFVCTQNNISLWKISFFGRERKSTAMKLLK